MAFTLDHFSIARPYLFHLTARDNLACIQEMRELLPTCSLLERAKEGEWRGKKRPGHIPVQLGRRVIWLRDQMPLHAGNMSLPPKWGFADLVELLNERVFFWPGRPNGLPISYGDRHFERYRNDAPVILRIPTADALRANLNLAPEFSRFNSGSPRCSGGRPSPRGPRTFLSNADADFTVRTIVEVTFRGPFQLPPSTQRSDLPTGPWDPVWA